MRFKGEEEEPLKLSEQGNDMWKQHLEMINQDELEDRDAKKEAIVIT